MQIMTLTPLFTRSIQVFSLSALFFVAACGEDANPTETTEAPVETIDPDKSTLLSVDGAVFSLPSPFQTSMLLKESGANYNKELLNDPQNYSRYSTKFQKAMNLGVYGADLGYVTMYEQTQDALGYLGAVRKIADDLGVTSAFDMSLVGRFEKNMGQRDSLLAMVSDAYRASDNYLKNHEQDHLGVLVLAGGWIESLHFATRMASETKNPELVKRVAEQRKTLENLIKLLSPFYSDETFTPIINNLIELHSEFRDIQYTYVYEKPTVDPDSRMTVINSRSEVNISEQQMQSITEKVQVIRNQIVG